MFGGEMMIAVGSMFAGIGGICSAFKKVDCEIVWANEIDKYACKTYRENFGDKYLVEDDIRNINPNEIPNIDILTAGFPCQPFSIAGKLKGFDDKRGQLFYQIERIIEAKKPRVVFLENVSNLEKHDKGKSFNKVFSSLAQFGYIVRYCVMNACEYSDIPQNRDRIYIVAFRDFEDNCKFKFPEKIEVSKPLTEFIDISKKHSDIYYYNSENKLDNLLNAKVLDHYRIYKIKDNGIFAFKSGKCPTLTANMGTYPNRVPVIRDNYGVRKLTPYELLAFQGFSKEFRFPQGLALNEAYKQIGNSVCVPVVENIAKEILKIFKK